MEFRLRFEGLGFRVLGFGVQNVPTPVSDRSVRGFKRPFWCSVSGFGSRVPLERPAPLLYRAWVGASVLSARLESYHESR